MMPITPDEGYIIEFISVGGSMKVTAIDPVTLIEAVVITPPKLSKQDATELAVRKLQYLIEKRKGQNENS